jgi:hypothetical protein
LQLIPTNPHWALVVGYGPFSLSLIHKEGLCLSSGDINRLMMMMMMMMKMVVVVMMMMMEERTDAISSVPATVQSSVIYNLKNRFLL